LHHPKDEPKGSLREPWMRVWEFTRCHQNAALIYYSFPGCGSLKVFSEYHNEKRPVRLKFDRQARMYCLAGENGHFQIIMSQPPSLFFFLSSQTILGCFAIALWVPLGPISPLVLLPPNSSLLNCYLVNVSQFSIDRILFWWPNGITLFPSTNPGSSLESGRILKSFT